MARVVLVNHVGFPSSLRHLMPDVGLATVASSLLRENHEVSILDYGCASTVDAWFKDHAVSLQSVRGFRNGACDPEGSKQSSDQTFTSIMDGEERHARRAAQEVLRHLGDTGTEIVMMKLWSDGYSSSVRIASAIKKEHPLLTIVAAGPHVDLLKGHILKRCSDIDVLALGDGEVTIPLLAERAALRETGFADIPNLIYREGDRLRETPRAYVAHLDDHPDPVYDPSVYRSVREDEKILVFAIDDSRGCPFRCRFCIHPDKSGRVWRTRDPGRITRLMGYLQETTGSSLFHLTGSDPPPEHLNALANRIREEDLRVHFTSFSHLMLGERLRLDDLKRAGCEAIFYGFESGSPRVLKGMGKRLDRETAVRTIRRTREAGIYVITSVILPCPGEDTESIEETRKMLIEARPDSVLVHPPVVFPGTEWARYPNEYGFELDNDFLDRWLDFRFTPLLSDEVMRERRQPYHVRGRTDAETYEIAAGFIREISKEGMAVDVADIEYLLSRRTGFTLDRLKDISTSSFIASRSGRMGEVVRVMNREMLEGGRDAAKHNSLDV